MLKIFIKRLLLFFCVFALCFAYVPNVMAVSDVQLDKKIRCEATINDDFSDDKVLVVLNDKGSYSTKNYYADDFVSYGCTSVDDLTACATVAVQNELLENVNMRRIKSKNANTLVNTEKYRRVLCLKLNKKSKKNVLKVAGELLQRDDVYYAGPDYAISIQSIETDDPLYSFQSMMANINLPQTWNFTRGSSDVVVGIVDSGIDSAHEDLRGSIDYELSRDFSVGGVDFVQNPIDALGHGTSVAGVVGAVGNNGKGISGVCQNVKLASLRVIDGEGNGFSSYVARAISFAEEMGIRILNLSIRWIMPDFAAYYDVALSSVIDSYNGVLICAAGNECCDIDQHQAYPASYDLNNLITVGATDAQNNRADFSNYGKNSVDVYAPGKGILTTAINNSYSQKDGTSFAAPFVTGVAALLFSIKPDLSGYAIKRFILDSADLISITLPQGATQTVKKLNAFSSIKGVLRAYAESENLSYGNVSFKKSIINGKTLFFESNLFKRLIVEVPFNYEFSVLSNCKIDIDVYDDNLNLVSLEKNMYSSGKNWAVNGTLTPGEYFLRVKCAELTIDSNIEVYINCPPHEHVYSEWQYRDKSSHVKVCECGQKSNITGAHQVSPEFAGAKKATCIFCHHLITLSDIIVLPEEEKITQ